MTSKSPTTGKRKVSKRTLRRWDEWMKTFPPDRRECLIESLTSEKERDALTRRFSDIRKFQSRFELAINFEGILVNGYDETTIAGYSAAIKLMLAYNAAEVLGHVLGVDVKKWKIENTIVAREYRCWLHQSMDSMNDELIASRLRPLHVGPRLVHEFLSVVNGRSDNIQVLAAVFRHSMAHGKLTSTFMSSSAAECASIQDHIADYLLQEVEERFSAFVDRDPMSFR